MENSHKAGSAKKQAFISIWTLTLMNVAIIAGLGNDVQEAFYGLSSVTYFAIGAICFFIPTALVAAELASGWSNRGGIFRWVGEGLGRGWALTCLLILWFQVSSCLCSKSYPRCFNHDWMDYFILDYGHYC